MRGEPEAIVALVEARAEARPDPRSKGHFIPRSLEDHPVYDTNNYHPYEPVPVPGFARYKTQCGVCGLAEHAVAHLPILVEKRDHGFLRPGGGRFATTEEAQAFIAEQTDSGRHVTPMGRVIDDIRYYVVDLRDAQETVDASGPVSAHPVPRYLADLDAEDLAADAAEDVPIDGRPDAA